MIVPTGDRILIKPDPIETKVGEIIVVQDEKIAKASTTTGVVVSLGELAFKAFVDGVFKSVYEPFAKVGDRVYYKRYTGVSVKDDNSDEEYILMTDSDVLGRFEKGE